MQYANLAEIPMQEAMSSSSKNEWKDAIYGEITNLVKNRVFDIADRPCDKNVVGCRTVLANKLGQSGEPVKRKARVVTQGFPQISGRIFMKHLHLWLG